MLKKRKRKHLYFVAMIVIFLMFVLYLLFLWQLQNIEIAADISSGVSQNTVATTTDPRTLGMVIFALILAVITTFILWFREKR